MSVTLKPAAKAKSTITWTPMYSAPPLHDDHAECEEWFLQTVRDVGKIMMTQVIKVTPTLAEVFLSHNNANRRCRTYYVAELASRMTKNEWLTTAETIAVDWNGVILNGQHRLTATIETGIARDFNVTFGANPDTFKVIDVNMRRSGGDVIHHANMQSGNQTSRYTNATAAAIRLIEGIRREASQGRVEITNFELANLYADYPNVVTHCGTASSFSGRFRKKFGTSVSISEAGVTAFLHYTEKAPQQMIDDFINGIINGGDPKDARSVVQQLLISRRYLDASNNPAYRTFVMLGHAWNYWRQDRLVDSERRLIYKASYRGVETETPVIQA